MVEDFAPLFRKRWRILLLTLALCLAVVVGVTVALPKTYTATATLSLDTRSVATGLSIDSQLGQDLTRSFSTLAGNPNVARDASELLHADSIDLSSAGLLAQMSFAPVEQTELLQITANASTPTRAQTLANVYAAAFVARVRRRFAARQLPTTVQLAEPAAVPSTPSKPNPPLYIGLGALLSALIALGVALFRQRFDQRLEMSETDTEVLGEPVMARMPTLKRGRGGADSDDAFLLLKVNLGFLMPNAPRVVAVTSSSPAEGKTTIATHLARAAARGRETVVLVEADLRRPTLAAGLDGARPSIVGLSNYLVGGASVSEIVKPHPTVPDLSVVWSGPPAPSAIPLLRSDALATLVAELGEMFDWVILDTPPVLLGPDATVVAAAAGVTLFVVNGPSTTRQSASRGLEQLRMVDVGGVLAVVINRTKTPDFAAYYGSQDRDDFNEIRDDSDDALNDADDAPGGEATATGSHRPID